VQRITQFFIAFFKRELKNNLHQAWQIIDDRIKNNLIIISSTVLNQALSFFLRKNYRQDLQDKTGSGL